MGSRVWTWTAWLYVAALILLVGAWSATLTLIFVMAATVMLIVALIVHFPGEDENGNYW